MGRRDGMGKDTDCVEICRNLQAGREEGAGLGNQRNKSRRGRGEKTIEPGAANRSDVWSSEVSARSSHTHSRAAENKPMVTKTKWIVSASYCRGDGQIGTASPEGIRIVGKAHLRRATTDGDIDFLQRCNKPQALRL